MGSLSIATNWTKMFAKMQPPACRWRPRRGRSVGGGTCGASVLLRVVVVRAGAEVVAIAPYSSRTPPPRGSTTACSAGDDAAAPCHALGGARTVVAGAGRRRADRAVHRPRTRAGRQRPSTTPGRRGRGRADLGSAVRQRRPRPAPACFPRAPSWSPADWRSAASPTSSASSCARCANRPDRLPRKRRRPRRSGAFVRSRHPDSNRGPLHYE